MKVVELRAICALHHVQICCAMSHFQENSWSSISVSCQEPHWTDTNQNWSKSINCLWRWNM